jgi:hypothetical protein
LDRKIADQFSPEVFEAWRSLNNFITAQWVPPERTYDVDEARDKVLDGMRTDLNRWWRHTLRAARCFKKNGRL